MYDDARRRVPAAAGAQLASPPRPVTLRGRPAARRALRRDDPATQRLGARGSGGRAGRAGSGLTWGRGTTGAKKQGTER